MPKPTIQSKIDLTKNANDSFLTFNSLAVAWPSRTQSASFPILKSSSSHIISQKFMIYSNLTEEVTAGLEGKEKKGGLSKIRKNSLEFYPYAFS